MSDDDGLRFWTALHADRGALVRAFGDEDFIADRLARQDRGHGQLLTAWLHEQLVGEVYLWMGEADEPEIRRHLPGVPLLNHVEVRSDLRNRRIGRRLVDAAERRLYGFGYDRVALAVRTDNYGAKRLYERLGYQDWGHSTVKCWYEERLADGERKQATETCHVMVKKLVSG
ncbi:GNAT family N-acetyltransferase [Actinocrispum sp. NPDC049592]|uniref:GNAT family N-acetyltransferase n=1 Tax=Actinocrispum sp. NPDC049592 TaxID=3154835 RepID=UPI0034341EFC